jgi:rare lipoprotein A
MPPISRGSPACFDVGAGTIRSRALCKGPAGGRLVRWLAVVLSAASLAACAQSPIGAKRAGIFSPSRQTALENSRPIWFAPDSRLVRAPAPRIPASGDETAGAHSFSQGIASFYTEGTQTANGERFDTNALTAAHRTLPFGTKLRVTSLTSGRSVTVRINDRGPFVKGRVVDLSHAAAKALGMVDAGVAKVRLDVVARPKRQARRVCFNTRGTPQAPHGCERPDRQA